jgi:hypothetical protein
MPSKPARRNQTLRRTQSFVVSSHLLTIIRRFRNPSAPFLLYSISVEQRFQKRPKSLSPERDRVNAMFFVFN